MRKLIILIDDEVMATLSELELKLFTFSSGKIEFEEIENYCKETSEKLYIEYQKLSSQGDFFQEDSSTINILYINKIRKYLDNLYLKDDDKVSSFNSLMLDLQNLRLEGYFYMSDLIENFLTSDKLFISTWIFTLNCERKKMKNRIQRSASRSNQLFENGEATAYDSLQQSLKSIEELIKKFSNIIHS